MLFTWQSISSAFLRSRLVFLDVLCISQTDENLKREGILGCSAIDMALKCLKNPLKSSEIASKSSKTRRFRGRKVISGDFR